MVLPRLHHYITVNYFLICQRSTFSLENNKSMFQSNCFSPGNWILDLRTPELFFELSQRFM